MKKLLMILLTLIMIAGMSGCSGTTAYEKGYQPPIIGGSVESFSIETMQMQTVLISIKLPYQRDGAGSGVIINSKKGIIVTAAHLFGIPNSTMVVTDVNGNKYDVNLDTCVIEEKYDMAVIYLKKNMHLSSAPIRLTKARVGEAIVVIGSPGGVDFFNTVSTGIISGTGRFFQRKNQIRFYQTDAAINPGNSGGPWFDSEGRLIAISSMKIMSADNLAFGVPIYYLKKLIELDS